MANPKMQTRNIIHKLNHSIRSPTTTQYDQTQLDELLEKIALRCLWFIIGACMTQLIIYFRLGIW